MSLQRYTPLRKRSLKLRVQRESDPKYLKWIRSQPCVICGSSYTEAAHVGPRGFGLRCDDHQAIPLCPGHHRTRRDAQHVLGKNFWEYHGLDRWVLIQNYNAAYTSA